MSYILNIETATKVCSVNVIQNGNTIAYKEAKDENYSHSEKLHSFIKDVLVKAKVSINDLDAVCVSKGPGSYTGLRIGVSAAKGLCYALDIPLIGLNTLETMAKACIQKYDYDLYIPMIDARRMEVYTTIYDKNSNCILPTCANEIDENSFNTFLQENKILIFGNGAEKCKNKLTAQQFYFLENDMISSNYMGILAQQKYDQKDFEDIAYFEPYYLKDFVITKPKKK